MLKDKKEKILQNTKNTKDLRVTFFIYCDHFSLKSLKWKPLLFDYLVKCIHCIF